MNKRAEELKKMFDKEGFTRSNGMEIIDVDENGSKVKVKLTEKHRNAAGTIHGGLMFSLADFAFGVATNYLHPLTLSSSASITYLAPCTDSKYLTAECSEVSRYHRTCVCNATVKDDKDNVICNVLINGFIKDFKE